MKTKKKAAPKRQRVMQFYNLRLNVQDIDHLRYLLECECEMQQELMDKPDQSKSVDERLEDWIVSRDMKCYALRVLQMIDKVKGGKA